MHMVEGADQFRHRGIQHPVTEHITGHIPDADTGEGVNLTVRAHFTEVPFHAFPGAAGGNAHFLVIVALTAAGSEGVIQPETIFRRNRVGIIREGRRSLIRRDNKIGIVIIPAHYINRRYNFTADQIVGDIQH